LTGKKFLFADHARDTGRRELRRGAAQPNILRAWIAGRMPIRQDATRERTIGSLPPRGPG
jgi:hypothetical protein